MAMIKRELILDAPVEDVWAVIGDFARGPIRMAPGFVTGIELPAPDLRIVTFVNESVLHERFITLDNNEHRFVYSIVGGSVTPEHNNASMQVFPHDNGRSRFVWIHDVLPHELAEGFGPGMDAGLNVFKATMEGAAAQR